jgi:pyruvate/2-oxoglutarate dehydrogenase complex dihydrolipoamide dehydrogenase (E3) component
LVLGTGAATVFPAIPGIDLHGVSDYATLIEDMDFEPSRCVIIGGSKVALEYGSFFQAAGCPTTIVARRPLMRTASLHHVDEDLRLYVVDGMRKRGIEILEGVEPLTIKGNNGTATAVVIRDANGQEQTLPCAEGTMLYAFQFPELSGFQKAVVDAESRRMLGFHHVGFGAKDAFQLSGSPDAPARRHHH